MYVPHGVRIHWGTAIRPTRWWALLPRSHSSQTKIHRIEMDRVSGFITASGQRQTLPCVGGRNAISR